MRKRGESLYAFPHRIQNVDHFVGSNFTLAQKSYYKNNYSINELSSTLGEATMNNLLILYFHYCHHLIHSLVINGFLRKLV